MAKISFRPPLLVFPSPGTSHLHHSFLLSRTAQRWQPMYNSTWLCPSAAEIHAWCCVGARGGKGQHGSWVREAFGARRRCYCPAEQSLDAAAAGGPAVGWRDPSLLLPPWRQRVGGIGVAGGHEADMPARAPGQDANRRRQMPSSRKHGNQNARPLPPC